MDFDIAAQKGRRNKPVIVFIHGLGMDKRIWIAPDEARMLGGRFPVKYLLSKKPEPLDYGLAKNKPYIDHSRFSLGEAKEDMKTSFTDLQALGYSVITWSQKRPAGPIDAAVAELKAIVGLAKRFSGQGIVLIGHSRGGLVARKYLESKDRSIKGLITLASPHYGSTMAKWAEHIAPLASIIGALIQAEDKKKISYTVKRVLDFISSNAIKELLPDSEFLRSLKDTDKTCGLSFGGTNPNLFTVYRWKLKKLSRRGLSRWLLKPSPLLTMPDILEKIFPGKAYPAELRKGYGDGLVSAKSSVLPYCREHLNFNLNHAAILFDERVRKKVAGAVEGMR